MAAGTTWLLWFTSGSPDLSAVPLEAKDRLDLVKVALTVTGGVGAVVALVVAYRKQRFGEVDSVRENTKLFNERYTKACEQLGSDKSAVRLGGVYAMAGLADDWAAGRQTCIDVLCSYLRMPYTPPVDPDAASAAETTVDADGVAELDAWTVRRDSALAERQVRHTIIRTITTRLRDTAAVSWQGHDLDFSGATFDGGDFRKATFSGGLVDFQGAMFAPGFVNFQGATFTGGTVDFSGAKFSGGDVNFTHAWFSGGEVRFIGATFASGHVHFSSAMFAGGQVGFNGAAFSGSVVAFSGATFLGGDVTFQFATFSSGLVGFHGAAFLGGGSVRFSTATFSGGLVAFHGATFTGADVGFLGSTFTGGSVDLSRPHRYDVPPIFSLDMGTPGVILLPPSPADRAAVPSP
ncbi:hypothetical protein Lfu02_79120 [Longispora fulva]|nr:hypothetical protein Lfu02_79120 [Longispora fulva]